ncbi:hypothetical protein DCAR_0521993 [Daucus carota subsp. sativus]|uniref:Uncharacterized protein n=1 Tax=Daucus carota subsp. sativus TaxID=79200 RepID=A0A164ZIB6_DAUCS|nr:hypothetical protein DCAR_0521993 [Daucus carota subsp. sativus]
MGCKAGAKQYCSDDVIKAYHVIRDIRSHKNPRASTKKAETDPVPEHCVFCAHWKLTALKMAYQDFLGVGVASAQETADPEASGGMGIVINLEDDEDEAPELDLELKL